MVHREPAAEALRPGRMPAPDRVISERMIASVATFA